MFNRKNTSAILLLLVIVFSILIRLSYLEVPLERDEGGYAYIAWRIGHGEVPYKDIYDNKPPGIYYLYLAAIKLLGPTAWSIHLFLCLWIIGEILLVYLLAKKLFNVSVGLAAALIFSFMTASPAVQGFSANTEIFMLLPIIVSYLFITGTLEARTSWTKLIICGVLIGTGIVIKQVCVYNLVALVIFLTYQLWHRDEHKHILQAIAYLVAGCFLVPLLCFLYFWWKGAAADLIYWAFKYNFDYMSVASPFFTKDLLVKGWERFGEILKGDWFFWLLGIYALIVLYKEKKPVFVLVTSWLVMALVGVAAGRHFFPHYFLQMIPPIALAAAWGLWHLLALRVGRIPQPVLRSFLGVSLVLMAVLVPLKSNYKFWFYYTPEEISRNVAKLNPFIEARAVADYISGQTSAADTVGIIGSEPEMLFYMQRKSATKYIFFYHVLWHVNKEEVLLREKEVVRDIENSCPKYLIANNVDASMGILPDTPSFMFEQLRNIIKERYYLDGLILYDQGLTLNAFGQEQVKKLRERLNADQCQIRIYKKR